uniref:Large ribosomal subunit protein eL24-related N-terminal domain-containing protein n=1 Tax=Glossina palpalis gambiensis TaxID=67801 RepID=A0A1B0BK48_9MUSC
MNKTSTRLLIRKFHKAFKRKKNARKVRWTKGCQRQVEIGMDVKDIQRNISLIRSPAAGLKERPTHEEAEH